MIIAGALFAKLVIGSKVMMIVVVVVVVVVVVDLHRFYFTALERRGNRPCRLLSYLL